jgi:L-iditol 2-dehydrogenase
MRSMRAALLVREREIEVREVPLPELRNDDEVLIRVQAVGICGSEVHAFKGTHPYRKAPVILGHEMAGEVVSAGSTTAWGTEPGQRVIVDPQWPCGACEYCRSGDYNLCPDKRVLGTAAWPGAFGAYVIAPVQAIRPLPRSLSFVQGAMIEPLSIGVHLARRADLRAGESIVVLGTGAVGCMAAAVARQRGCSQAIGVDINAHCLAIAEECMGVTHGLLGPGASQVEKVLALTRGRGADATFVCADAPDLVDAALRMTCKRGRVVLAALIGQRVELDPYTIIQKELQVIGSIMSNEADLDEAIHLAATGHIDVGAVVTHTLPLSQVQRGMELAATKAEGALKVILQHG